MGPSLRDSRLLGPSGRGGEFTQPRAHLLAESCTVPKILRLIFSHISYAAYYTMYYHMSFRARESSFDSYMQKQIFPHVQNASLTGLPLQEGKENL